MMQQAYDKIRAALDDTASRDAVEAMGWALARMDGEEIVVAFERNRTKPERSLHDGYVADAEYLIRQLRERGFDVVRIGG